MTGKPFTLRIGNTVFPVTERQYREHYREMERWKYIKRTEKGKKLSLEQAVEDELPLEDMSGDGPRTVEAEVEQKILIERMHEAMELLEVDEKHLLQQLFFDGITLRELARNRGIPVMTLHYQQQQVLKKLKNLLGF